MTLNFHFQIIVGNLVGIIGNIINVMLYAESLCYFCSRFGVAYFFFGGDITERLKSVIHSVCSCKGGVTVNSACEGNPRMFPFFEINSIFF